MVRVDIPNGPGLALPDGPGCLCWMGWDGLAGCAGLVLLDGPDVFARWAGLAVPDGLGFFAGQTGLA